MSPSQAHISNSVDKFLRMEEEEGLTHLLWLERNEGPSWISREAPPEISLILHPHGWMWSSTFQEKWRWKGNLGRKEHLQGWTIWTGITMLWSYDAFHGCGKSRDMHNLVICLGFVQWPESVMSSPAGKPHRHCGRCMCTFLPRWTAKHIFQLNLFFGKASYETGNASIFNSFIFWVLNELQSLCSAPCCLLSFNIPRSTVRVKLPSCPFYRWASWGLEGANDLAKRW